MKLFAHTMVDQTAELKLELEPGHKPNALYAAFPTDTHIVH